MAGKGELQLLFKVSSVAPTRSLAAISFGSKSGFLAHLLIFYLVSNYSTLLATFLHTHTYTLSLYRSLSLAFSLTFWHFSYPIFLPFSSTGFIDQLEADNVLLLLLLFLPFQLLYHLFFNRYPTDISDTS